MKSLVYFAVIVSFPSFLVMSCSPSTTLPIPTPVSPAASPTSLSLSHAGAFYTAKYRNLFKEYLGKSDVEVQTKLEAAWQQLFYGDDHSERVYYPLGEDMAYIEDIGNNDVRTEGMSY